MLGTVAKKLRILGFDCTYFASISDDDIALIAQGENRVLITMDRILAQKCRKQGMQVIHLAPSTEAEQLIEIARGSGLRKYRLDASSARCSACNGILVQVDRQAVTSLVPERVAEYTSCFWQCHDCRHVYWEGSHIRNIKRVIDEINARI